MHQMEGLVRAVADFFAAVLSTVGYVGRPRRRAQIREDMRLVTELAEHPDFGHGSWPHQALMNRVALDIGRLGGVPIPGRKFPWSSAFLTVVIGAPLGYWAIRLNDDGFVWYSIFPGFIAAVMAVALFGLVVEPQEQDPDHDGDGFAVMPLAGDINAKRDDLSR